MGFIALLNQLRWTETHRLTLRQVIHLNMPISIFSLRQVIHLNMPISIFCGVSVVRMVHSALRRCV